MENVEENTLKPEMTRHAIFPSQYVGKWTNDSGVRLRIFQILDLDTQELVKVFVPQIIFTKMEIQKLIKSGDQVAYKLGFRDDSEGRESLISISLLGGYKVAFDNA